MLEAVALNATRKESWADLAPLKEGGYTVGENLTDWLGDNSWAIWLSLAFLLTVAEVLSLDLVLIMLAVGALAGAAVAVVTPGLWWLQILTAAAVSVLMLLLLRPTLLKRIRNMPGYRSSTAKLVGGRGARSISTGRAGRHVPISQTR